MEDSGGEHPLADRDSRSPRVTGPWEAAQGSLTYPASHSSLERLQLSLYFFCLNNFFKAIFLHFFFSSEEEQAIRALGCYGNVAVSAEE